MSAAPSPKPKTLTAEEVREALRAARKTCRIEPAQRTAPAPEDQEDVTPEQASRALRDVREAADRCCAAHDELAASDKAKFRILKK